MRASRNAFLIASLCTAFVGCSSAPAPTDHFYRIEVGAPSAPAAKRLDGMLKVDRFRVDALTGERHLLYRQSDDAAEIRQHPYQLWADPPALMLQTQLISFLGAAQIADVVLPATARVEPDYEITGQILRLERVLEPSAHVAVELQLSAARSTRGALLLHQSCRERRDVDGEAIAASVAAFGEAVRACFEQFLAELGGIEP
ncbi:MAG TPA: ABC-type transport auxiliary lipoprotein family protein [Myxococcota bacterium]|nr:ABC-type transport auxiliary lipoprotein family protein [Myxococcota bacterium]